MDPPGENPPAGINPDRASVARQSSIEPGPAIVEELIANGALARHSTRRSKSGESGEHFLLPVRIEISAAVRIRPESPNGSVLLHPETFLPVPANRFESREFQHAGKARSRVVELVRSNRAHH